jgi:hypothetical protein
VDLEPALVRQEYLQNVRAFLEELKRLCGKVRCDYQLLPTEQPVGETLASFLNRRGARLKQT